MKHTQPQPLKALKLTQACLVLAVGIGAVSLLCRGNLEGGFSLILALACAIGDLTR